MHQLITQPSAALASAEANHRSLITPLRWWSAFILIALGSLTLLPNAQALVPAPDGGYPGGNTAEGQNALFSLTTGGYNTAVGFLSLRSDTTGSLNTAVGAGTLLANTADQVTATGAAALLSNTTGCCNTANGAFALSNNTTGASNQAFGFHALLSNTTGSWNNAFGGAALNGNTTGNSNCAFGDAALLFNTTGSFNVAIGRSALYNNDGYNNTAVGYLALYQNTTGGNNTANGDGALFSNTSGSFNTALGIGAGQDLTMGNGNVCIGAFVAGVTGESNTTRIRNIFGSVASERAVYVNSDDKIGTLASSRRFKEEIKPMEKASEVLFALKPVSFRYKKEFDAGRAPMFGLIAEEVEQVDPGLVSRNEKGDVETVRYEQINAMLLNEFLKEHKKVQELCASDAEQKKEIADQRKEIRILIAQLKEQAAVIEKMSAKIEVSKIAPQVACLPAVASREGGNNH